MKEMNKKEDEMHSLTKEGLVLRMKEKGYSKVDSRAVINDIFNLIAEALVSGETITIRGFGSLGTKVHKGHSVYNAAKKEVQEIGDYKVISFKPGVVLKDAVRTGDVGKLSALLKEAEEN